MTKKRRGIIPRQLFINIIWQSRNNQKGFGIDESKSIVNIFLYKNKNRFTRLFVHVNDSEAVRYE